MIALVIISSCIIWMFIIKGLSSTIVKDRKYARDFKEGQELRKKQQEEYDKPNNKFKREAQGRGFNFEKLDNIKQYPYIVLCEHGAFNRDMNLLISISRYHNVQIGKSESILFFALNKILANNLLYGGGTVCFHYYYPDIAYIDYDKNIFIDIEIDEIYDEKNKSGIHIFDLSNIRETHKWIDQNSKRDSVFKSFGWTVIRFTEEQIIKELNECLEIIQYVINYWECKQPNFDLQASQITKSKRWSFKDAQKYGSENFREKLYENITFPKIDYYKNIIAQDIDNFKLREIKYDIKDEL